jgi:hypothetical protein
LEAWRFVRDASAVGGGNHSDTQFRPEVVELIEELVSVLCSQTRCSSVKAAEMPAGKRVPQSGMLTKNAPGVVEGLVSLRSGDWLTRTVSNYFLRGTFDVGDLIAVTLGAFAAACVMGLVAWRLDASGTPAPRWRDARG